MKDKGWVPYPRYIFRKEIVLSLINKYMPKGSRFLEISSAAGDIGMALSKIGYNGIMIDFSDEAYDHVIKNLKEEHITNVRFEKKNFLKIDNEPILSHKYSTCSIVWRTSKRADTNFWRQCIEQLENNLIKTKRKTN